MYTNSKAPAVCIYMYMRNLHVPVHVYKLQCNPQIHVHSAQYCGVPTLSYMYCTSTLPLDGRETYIISQMFRTRYMYSSAEHSLVLTCDKLHLCGNVLLMLVQLDIQPLSGLGNKC